MFCHPLGAVGHQSEEIPRPLLSRPAERAVLVHSWRQCGPPAMIVCMGLGLWVSPMKIVGRRSEITKFTVKAAGFIYLLCDLKLRMNNFWDTQGMLKGACLCHHGLAPLGAMSSPMMDMLCCSARVR